MAELVGSYARPVEKMATSDYWGRSDLEDVAACGMMGVFEAVRKMDVRRVKSVDAWVYMVARSRMRQYVERASQRTVALYDHRPTPLEEDKQNPLVTKLNEAMEDHDLALRATVNGEAMRLRGRERLVLALRFWGGWQLKEIAELLDCSTPNVWYIERRALEKVGLAL